MLRRDFIFLTAALALTGCASSGGGSTDTSGRLFSDQERQAITNFYAAQQRGPKPAVQAQRARIGEKLISGERPNKLPTDLDKLLPYLPDPYTRLVLGADVILVNRNTHDILDVVPQVAY